MRRYAKERETLQKLLKVARARTDEVSARVADLQAARASAEESLLWLDRAVDTESCAASVNLVDLARYVGGATEKRKSLKATCAMLDREIAAARDDLAAAFAEMKKFEHLLSLARRTERRLQSKREMAALDDAARLSRPA